MSLHPLSTTMFKTNYTVRNESGVVLVTALLLLVVMTLFGLSGVRLIAQQERMAAFSYDRGLAFQAAEAALRQAEIALEVVKPTPLAGPCTDATFGGATVRICPPPPPTAMNWTDATYVGWASVAPVGTGTRAVTPQYFAEYLGEDFPCGRDPNTAAPICKRYRISARAGAAGRANAMVQSIYATD